MKNLITLILSLSVFILSAQNIDRFTQRNGDGRPHDPMMDQMDFVPNEVLVKFKDEIKLTSGTSLKSAGISSIDRVLKNYSAGMLVKLFPTETKLKSARIVKDPLGQDMIIPCLHNIYKITLSQLKSTGNNPPNVLQAVEELKALPEVEYAEPNYIFTIADFKLERPEMTMLEAMEQTANNKLSTEASGVVPNDPLYSQQWGIPACNIDDVWNTNTGDSTSVIAIIDTGVDYLHPDLAKNIWQNKQEIAGNGIDDDGNGKIDDIRGWDFIDNDNDPKDDNSHGTHCAGIAAAVGNNNIGITGVNWRAKIMPVKVIQSSGRGDAATIAQGVTYAVNKGAKVISMSFGSYAESLTLKTALANAYATAVLVAAAGNDAIAIGPCLVCAPMFPAAYSFVLGIEANSVSNSAGFTNYDQDGPVYSEYPELNNYELKAPGTGIISTIPGGNYREYSGTSMAAALVSGAISLYKEKKPAESTEMLFGNFINSISRYIDLEKALNIIPEPQLNIVSYELNDTIDGDKDGRPDAGETLALFVKVRNTWGQANDVKVGIALGEFEDPTIAQILTNEANVGNISVYSTRSNTIPLIIKIKSDVTNGRDIELNLKTWYGNHQGEKIQKLVINVENGVELKGIIMADLTLYPNKQYFIKENIAITKGVNLFIKPGTTIKIAPNAIINNLGTIRAIGKKDSLIAFTSLSNEKGWNGISQCFSFIGEYVNYNNVICTTSSVFFSSSYATLKNCIFSNNKGWMQLMGAHLNDIKIEKCCFYYNNSQYKYQLLHFLDCFISDNNIINNEIFPSQLSGALRIMNIREIKYLYRTNIFSNYSGVNEANLIFSDGAFSVEKIESESIYFGTTLNDKISKSIIDFPETGQGQLIDFSNKMNSPSKENHGIVWKILIQGKDAQDEFDKLDPLGVGKHKFEVFFNRPMDIKYPPSVSMGVRYPYTQTSIAEGGTWSKDSTIYTVYGSVGLTNGDGINTIRVTGAKDTDHFEIPVEDRRFRVIVNAAGIASSEFMATPGPGNIRLEWSSAKLEDGLGYNMYRKEQVNDSTLSSSVLINSILITDTLYTDYAVTPNKKYFYYYKVLRTNLVETDSSKMVAAVPLTGSKGDANGDSLVNGLDLTAIVSYLLNQNPNPFIYEAANVVKDNRISIQDIVGIVNLIHGQNQNVPLDTVANVKVYLKNDTLFADIPVTLGAVQFDIRGVSGLEEILKLKALEGFETSSSIINGTLRLIIYSLSGKNIPAGNGIPLLRLKKGSGIVKIELCDIHGSPVSWKYLSTGLWNLHKLDENVAQLGQNYPNPFTNSTTIPVFINEPVDELYVRIININGQQVAELYLKNPVIGENFLHWDSGSNKGLMAYYLEISRNGKSWISGIRKMLLK